MSPVARTARLGVLAVVLAAAAWLFWPAPLGGSATYVTTHGISMEPRFSTGDLAILHTSGTYSVGDVVAYRSEALNTVVMHRLVSREGDRFTVQGDNNDFTDPDHPTADQILGRLWVRVPHGGTVLGTLRSSRSIALLALLVPVLLLPRGRRGDRRGDRRGGRKDAPSRAARPPARRRTSSLVPVPVLARARQAAMACGAVVLVAALAEAILLVLPATQSGTDSVLITQQGRFAYSGTATAGTTYPTGRIATGDPVYVHLATSLTTTYSDTVSRPLSGTLRLDVVLSTPDGWTVPVTSGPATTVAGRTASATVAIDLAAASALLDRHTTEVGASSGTATLSVEPRLSAAGTVAGRPFSVASQRALAFTLDATVLKPAAGPAALTPTTPTSVSVPDRAPRELAVGRFSLPLRTARIALGVVLAAALAGLGIAAPLGRRRPHDDAGDLLLRCAARILPVRRFTPGSVVVDVEDGAALQRVAERLDALVLHADGAEGQVFAVQDGETTYRFTVPPAAAAQDRPRLAAVPGGRALRRAS